MRVPIACSLALALAACSGGDENATPSPAPTRTSKQARATALAPSAPLMKMASGTDQVDGVLAVWCDGEDCKRAPGAAPLRYVEGAENGLLLFEASAAPRAARVELRSAGRVLTTSDLKPGTTMAFATRDVPKGRYRVVLTALWPKREGRWVFGVTGPIG